MEPTDRAFREGDARRGTNELILPNGEFAYTRDTTSGVTHTSCGPTVISAQGSFEPVVFDHSSGRFRVVPLDQAAQTNVLVPTGHYCLLGNPSGTGKHPQDGDKAVAPELLIGQRVNLPGPRSFALWPRQQAQVIEGHQLRSNQYLLGRVYDETAARENWSKGVVQKAVVTTEGGEESEEPTETTPVVADASVPEDLSVGRLIVIRGTEVSFYMPPTGVEVVPEAMRGKGNVYVREALTLERLQYCILVDEDGNKRYVRGPDVVFPTPTETFYTNDDDERVFRPIELNGSIQGLHVRVIADYKDTEGSHGVKGKEYKTGEELFLTGEETPIYFPCEQHAVVKYADKSKHYATAVPAGDGRYMLNRHSGVIRTETGGEKGTMILPDPRKEVFVRRVLGDSECKALYPGNGEVLEYNQALREVEDQAPSDSRMKGAIADDMEALGTVMRRMSPAHQTRDARFLSRGVGDAEFANTATYSGTHSAEMAGDEFSRSTTYSKPRQVTLGDDKFAGVPKIDVWTGFAVLVKDTAGNRRVEKGPVRVLLDFNETLETLTLSRGKPKTTDKLLTTAYMQVTDNKVTDMIRATTSDHVVVEIKVVPRVSFGGDDPIKWFSVANYVKMLCDHARSVVKGAVRSITAEEFYSRSEDFVRDAILGKKPKDTARAGMHFPENGMTVYDVEVLDAKVVDEGIQQMLTGSSVTAVRTGIQLAESRRALEAHLEQETIKRKEAEASRETEGHAHELQLQRIAEQEAANKRALEASKAEEESRLEHQKAKELVAMEANDAALSRQRAKAELDQAVGKARVALTIEEIEAETAATVARMEALKEGLGEALLALGNQDTLVKVAEAMSVQQLLGGKNLPDVVGKVFEKTPLADLAAMIQDKAIGKLAPRTHRD